MKKVFKCVYRLINIGLFIKAMILSLLVIFKGKRTKFGNRIQSDVLLCGNGPSLSFIDLEKVKADRVEIACVNYFPIKNSAFFSVKPKYLFLIDPWFYTKPNDKVFETFYEKQNMQLFDALNKVDWEMVVVSYQGYSLPISNENVRNEHICRYSAYGEPDSSMLDGFYKRNLLKVGAMNVCVAALFYLINQYSGRIYLSGIDMSEFKNVYVDENNNMFVENVHSYGTRREPIGNYAKKGEFYKLLGYYQKMFEQFFCLSKYAERRGNKIVNLSLDSYLDMFPKEKVKLWETS